MRVVTQAQATRLTRIRVNSSVDTSYPSRGYTSTIPHGERWRPGSLRSATELRENYPFWPEHAAQTFLMRAIGWQQETGGSYFPIDLYEATVTLGTTQGTGSWLPATTIASASNNVALPVSTINLTSTTGFSASGSVLILTSAGPQIVNYSGITGNALTGCVGGNGTQSTGQVTGTLLTGAAVSQWGVSGNAVTANDFFASTIVTSVGTDGRDSFPLSPANNQIASVNIATRGSSFFELLFDRNSSATQCNALIGAL